LALTRCRYFMVLFFPPKKLLLYIYAFPLSFCVQHVSRDEELSCSIPLMLSCFSCPDFPVEMKSVDWFALK
jgi:hypothetical protein